MHTLPQAGCGWGLTPLAACRFCCAVQGSAQPHPQQRLHQLRQLQQELLDKRQQQQGRAASKTPSQQQQQQQQARFHRPSPPAQPSSQQYNLQVGGYSGGGSPQPQHLPASYPHSREQRLQQLAQPKALQRQKYDQVSVRVPAYVVVWGSAGISCGAHVRAVGRSWADSVACMRVCGAAGAAGSGQA